jgi:GT2 family glycosyltransferase
MALVAPIVMDSAGRIWSAGTDLYLRTGKLRSVRHRVSGSTEPTVLWLSGACLMLSAELWSTLGGFDEDYFLYWEDVDLSMRAIDKGATLIVEGTATAIHDEGGTQVRVHRDAKSEAYYFFNTRNRLVFAAKHLDRQGGRRWSRTSVQAAWEILLRGGRRQFIRPARPVLAATRGTIEGHRAGRRIRQGRDPLGNS